MAYPMKLWRAHRRPCPLQSFSWFQACSCPFIGLRPFAGRPFRPERRSKRAFYETGRAYFLTTNARKWEDTKGERFVIAWTSHPLV